MLAAALLHLHTAPATTTTQSGNPGTGKTTVAKLYAGILRDLGLLSKGDAVLKTASDFVGSVLGASESATRAILKAAEGCVCVIDEAYGLHSSAGGAGVSGGGGDPYRTAVIDTIVEQVSYCAGSYTLEAPRVCWRCALQQSAAVSHCSCVSVLLHTRAVLQQH